jgi:hypothetical protein
MKLFCNSVWVRYVYSKDDKDTSALLMENIVVYQTTRRQILCLKL